MDISISDHLPTYLIVKKAREKKTSVVTKGRSYKSYNVDLFQSKIKTHIFWPRFWYCNNVEQQWDIMHSIILSVLDECCPVKDIKFFMGNDDWLSQDVIEEISEKNRLHKIACTSGLSADWAQFKIARKYARTLLLKGKHLGSVSYL